MTFIQTALIYLLIYTLFVLIGRGFFIIYSKLTNRKVDELFKIDKFYFYLFTGVFVLSNCIFILNFFLPAKSNIIIFVILIFVTTNFFRIPKKSFNKNKLLYIFTTPLVVSIFNNNGSTDSFMYHFANQKIIFEEKIILGLSNLTETLGYASIFEYISSIFWLDDIYTYVQLINLLFIGAFYHLIIHLFNNKNYYFKNLSLLILIVGIIDNFGFDGGRNGFIFIQEVGKFDASFGIVFFICFLIITLINYQKILTSTEIHFAFLAVTFLSQIKPFGYILFFPLFFIIYNKTKLKVFNYLFRNYIFLLVNVLWLLKSVLNNSCMIYPVQFTCFKNLPWHFPGQAKLISLKAISNNRDPNVGLQSIGNMNWVTNYWINENTSYILNIILTILILFIIFKNKNRFIDNFNDFNLFFFTFVYIALWFFYFPNYRFATGYFLSLYLIIFSRKLLSPLNSFYKIIYQKNVFYILFTFCLLFTVRVDSYRSLISNYSDDISIRYTIPDQNYIKRLDSFGVYPENFYCFINTQCSISDQKIDEKILYSYKTYTPVNKSVNEDILDNINDTESSK